MSKGSNPRPVDATKYRENWDRIFARHVCPTCGGGEGWEDHTDRDGLLMAVWVPCPWCNPRSDAAGE